MRNLVINFPLQRIEHTYLLTSSPYEFEILFVLEEFHRMRWIAAFLPAAPELMKSGQCSLVISNR